MPFDADYRELIADTQEAITRLLDASTPDSWGYLRLAWRSLDSALARDEQARCEATREAAESARECERRSAWQRLPAERREAMLFDALGDERLTKRQLRERLNRRAGALVLMESDVASLVRRLHRDGQLDREGEAFQGKVRYRYFRSRRLDGAIADLERAFQGSVVEATATEGSPE